MSEIKIFKRSVCCLGFMIFLSTFSTKAYAHHGGVSAAFGPGAPVETASPMTLKKGQFLFYERVEVVPYRKFGFAEPANIDKFTFISTMFGYGIFNSLSFYVSVPYSMKEQDSFGTSSGFADPELIFQYGFKYGERRGFKGWYPFNIDDVEGKEYTLDDWKFGLTASFSIPSGNIHNKDTKGNTFSMGMQPGFGAISYNFTAIMSKMIMDHLTYNADIGFRTFAFGPDGKPGNEFRFNNAALYEVFEKKKGFLSRVDMVGEANFLGLTKDMDGARGRYPATGGKILYLSPGMRITFKDRLSLGLLVKFPVIKDLNNKSQQQGAEGLERFRAIGTFSFSF